MTTIIFLLVIFALTVPCNATNPDEAAFVQKTLMTHLTQRTLDPTDESECHWAVQNSGKRYGLSVSKLDSSSGCTTNDFTDDIAGCFQRCLNCSSCVGFGRKNTMSGNQLCALKGSYTPGTYGTGFEGFLNKFPKDSAYGSPGWNNGNWFWYNMANDGCAPSDGNVVAPAGAYIYGTPTPSPTPPTPSPTPAAASASGDPHVVNIRGEKFDIMSTGKVLMASVKSRSGETSDFIVTSLIESVHKDECSLTFIQEVNIGGNWVGEELTIQTGEGERREAAVLGVFDNAAWAVTQDGDSTHYTKGNTIIKRHVRHHVDSIFVEVYPHGFGKKGISLEIVRKNYFRWHGWNGGTPEVKHLDLHMRGLRELVGGQVHVGGFLGEDDHSGELEQMARCRHKQDPTQKMRKLYSGEPKSYMLSAASAD